MQRVMIVGQPGAGKSTLARALGHRTGLPVVHVDEIHWMSGWQERPRPEKVALALAHQAQETWIFEGGLSDTWPDRLLRADTLIVLDLSLGLRMWRVFLRTLRYHGESRPDLPEGCPERFDPEFWWWIWDTRKTGRDKMLKLIETATLDTTIAHLTSPRKVRRFLSALDSGQR